MLKNLKHTNDEGNNLNKNMITKILSDPDSRKRISIDIKVSLDEMLKYLKEFKELKGDKPRLSHINYKNICHVPLFQPPGHDSP